jgi:hypothetical protein
MKKRSLTIENYTRKKDTAPLELREFFLEKELSRIALRWSFSGIVPV